MYRIIYYIESGEELLSMERPRRFSRKTGSTFGVGGLYCIRNFNNCLGDNFGDDVLSAGDFGEDGEPPPPRPSRRPSTFCAASTASFDLYSVGYPPGCEYPRSRSATRIFCDRAFCSSSQRSRSSSCSNSRTSASNSLRSRYQCGSRTCGSNILYFLPSSSLIGLFC